MSKESDKAHRARKGIIGMLECCRCLYPLRRYATSTEHDEACPTHRMTLSARMAGPRDEYTVVTR